MEKRVLFLQPDRLACYSLCSGQAEGQKEETSDKPCSVDMEWTIDGDQLPDSFHEYLQSNLHVQFNLVFDLPEEEFHLDEIKSMGFRDRRHVVERLRKKRLENALLSRAQIAGSGDRRLLLTSGIDGNALCENLIAEIMRIGVSLRSIHSSTTLTPAIVKQISVKDSLFIIPLNGCFRLVACAGQSVLFTRRVSSSGLEFDSNSDDYRALNQSVEETLLYVQRLQELWNPSIVFVGSASIADKFKSFRGSLITASQVVEIRNFWLSENQAVTNTAVETLLARTSMQAGRGYAQKTHRVKYVGRKMRNIFAAMVLCGLAGLGTSVAVAEKLYHTQTVVAKSYRQSALNFDRDIAQFESSYGQPVEAVRQALVAARLLELSSQEPLELLRTLAPSAHHQPDISISSVRWEADEIFDATLLVNLQDPPETLQSIPLEQIYRVTLAGVAKGKADTAFDQFESFVAALRAANEDPSIVVVETPFGLGEKRRITGNDYAARQGEFVLDISNEPLNELVER